MILKRFVKLRVIKYYRIWLEYDVKMTSKFLSLSFIYLLEKREG